MPLLKCMFLPRCFCTLVLCILCSGFVGFAPCLPVFADTGNTIGFIAPLTGPTSRYGLAAQNGVALAREDGGEPPFRIIWEDDEFKPLRSAAAFRKLWQIDRAKLVVVLGSPPSNAVAPLAEAASVPLLAWASDEQAAQGRRWVVRLIPSGKRQGRLLGEEARRRGYRRIAVVTSANDYSNSIKSGLLTVFSGGSTPVAEEVPPDMDDFRALVTRISTKGADAIGLCLNSGQVGQFARQARGAGLSLPLFSCDTLNSAGEIAMARGALDGAWFISGRVSSSFRRRYLQRFGNDDVLWTAAVYYDLIGMLNGAASDAAGGKDLLQRVLEKKVENGAFGSYGFVVSPEGDRYLEQPLTIHEVRASRILE